MKDKRKEGKKGLPGSISKFVSVYPKTRNTVHGSEAIIYMTWFLYQIDGYSKIGAHVWSDHG